MKIIETIEKEGPFNITPFKQFINGYDSYIEEDDWDWIYEECLDLGYTKEEIEEHSNEFKQIVSEFNESVKYWGLEEELNDALYRLSIESYTKKEIIDYINYWFNGKE